MTGTPELARAARWIIDRGGSVRLVGDNAQLTAGRLPMVTLCRGRMVLTRSRTSTRRRPPTSVARMELARACDRGTAV